MSRGRETVKLDGHLGSVSIMALTEDGTLITGDSFGEIKIWHVPALESVADSIKTHFSGASLDEQLKN